jgi:hypothetical protein
MSFRTRLPRDLPCGHRRRCGLQRYRDIWRQPESQWPRNPTGYVFLARAARMLGRAKFNPVWSDRIPGIRNALVAPIETRQFEIIQEVIARHCASGICGSAYRRRIGGSLERMLPDWWNPNIPHARFWSCELDPECPDRLAGSGAWIFLSEGGVNRLLHELSGGSYVRRGKGRPIGSGGHLVADLARLEKMKLLVQRGSSILHAAREVASEVAGHSYEATVDRLRKKFSRMPHSLVLPHE